MKFAKNLFFLKTYNQVSFLNYLKFYSFDNSSRKMKLIIIL